MKNNQFFFINLGHIKHRSQQEIKAELTEYKTKKYKQKVP